MVEYEERYTMGMEDDERYKNVVAMDEKVLKLHLKREPRFYAHIAADRCYYQLGKKNVLVEAYRESVLVRGRLPLPTLFRRI